jgi:hypothetical protein
MDYRCMVEGLEEVGKFFGEDYKPEAIKAVQSPILVEPNAAMARAYQRVISEFPQRFLPPLSKIRDIILQEGKRIREAEAIQREQEAAQRKAEEGRPMREPATPYGRACASFLVAAFSGNYSRAELLRMAEDGVKRFPGMTGFRGWVERLKPADVIPMDRRRVAGGNH